MATNGDERGGGLRPAPKRKDTVKQTDRSGIPRLCDFSCPHSDFPPPDTAGLCRTMAAVYCRKLKTLVDKHTPCRWRRGRGGKGRRRGR